MPEDATIKVTPRGKEYWLRPAQTGESFKPKPQQAEIDFKETLELPEITEEQKSNSPLKFHLETVAGLIEMGEQIPRYWSHRPPGTLGPSEDGGIQAYKISGRGGEAEAISEKFKDGSNQKIIWLQSPADPNDPYIVDASKLNLVNVGSETSGFQHAGDIPPEAIVKGSDTQPQQAEEIEWSDDPRMRRAEEKLLAATEAGRNLPYRAEDETKEGEEEFAGSNAVRNRERLFDKYNLDLDTGAAELLRLARAKKIDTDDALVMSGEKTDSDRKNQRGRWFGDSLRLPLLHLEGRENQGWLGYIDIDEQEAKDARAIAVFAHGQIGEADEVKGEYVVSPEQAESIIPFWGRTGKSDADEESSKAAVENLPSVEEGKIRLFRGTGGPKPKPQQAEDLKGLASSDPKTKKVLDTLAQHGKPYLVGGGVRDTLLGRPSKDVDIEVHGIELDDLAEIVERDLGGKQDQVGKVFGVFKVGDFDIALPRTETKTGAKHTDFDVKPDPNLSLEQAARRRDFTINALMYDSENDEILDFFGGQDDIKSKNIKHVDSKTFVEDPLRVYRAAQFASRFGFSIDPSTQKLARSMDLSDLPKERVFGEVQKMLLQSPKPSVGIHALDDMNVLDKHFSEISDLKKTGQRDDYHAEGDVFIHTNMALDEATKVIKRFPDEKDKTIIMLATLCHDLGKPATTNKETGQAIGHEDAGVDVAKKLLDKLTNDKEIVDTVLSLVKHHLKPGQLHRDRDTVKDSVFRRLINTHGTKFLDLLSGVAEADTRGRLHRNKDGSVSEPDSEEVDWFREKVKEVSESAGVKEGKIAPLISGDDLKDLGFKQGRELGDILRDIKAKQEDGTLETAKDALKYVRDVYKSMEESGTLLNLISFIENIIVKQDDMKKLEDPTTLLSLTDEIFHLSERIEEAKDDALRKELIDSGDIFAKFLLLKQQVFPTPKDGRGSKWDYTSSHTTMPEGAQVFITAQGKEWWLRTEQGTQQATQPKAKQQAKRPADIAPTISTESIVEADIEDFVSWKKWSKGFDVLDSDEVKKLTRQQQLAGLGNGKESETQFSTQFVKKNKEGKVVAVTTADGRLVPITETTRKDGSIAKRNVVFSTVAEAKIQSQYEAQNVDTGKFEVVRTYSFAHKASGTGNKFARLKNVQSVMPKIRSAVRRDLSSKKKVTRESAFAVALMDDTHRRVGGSAGISNTPADGKHGKPKKFDKKAIAEKKKKFKKQGKRFDAKKDGQIYERIRIKTYGITTLEARHVTQRKDGSVHLGFWGKDAVWNNPKITDVSLAKELLKRKAEAKSGTSTIVGTSETSVNNYLKAVSGIEMSAKDYRNFHATRIADEAATKMGNAPTVTESAFKNALVVAFKPFAEEKISTERKEEVARAVMLTLQEQRLIDTVGEVVAPQLGHKPSESIKTYVDPSVWEKVGWKNQFAEETERWVAKARTYSKQTLFPSKKRTPKKKKKS